jgi:RNA polymerase sigma factor (sigma-70 family)
MDQSDGLAAQFQDLRPRLHGAAFRLLGSAAEADDAVQEAWIRLSRSDTKSIENLEAWLVTTVGRAALNMLRSRRTRREEPWDDRLPDPIVERLDAVDPEHEAVLADSVGLALLVVLEQLTPAERLAYVLHDMFSIPFDEIAGILERSPESARQLASRGRRRIRGVGDAAPGSATANRSVVEAFLAAARNGDFRALVEILDPDVVLREDNGSGGLVEVRGAEVVAGRARSVSRRGVVAVPALVNGAVGWVSYLDDEVYAIGAMAVRAGRIVGMDILVDPARIATLDLTELDG